MPLAQIVRPQLVSLCMFSCVRVQDFRMNLPLCINSRTRIGKRKTSLVRLERP